MAGSFPAAEQVRLYFRDTGRRRILTHVGPEPQLPPNGAGRISRIERRLP